MGSHCLPPGGGISGWALGGCLEPHGWELTLFCSSLCSEAECLPTTDTQSTFVLFGVLETDHNWVFYLGKKRGKTGHHPMKLSALMQLHHTGKTSQSCSPPPANIYRKPKALGSVLQAHHTEKERLGSQGAFCSGGRWENLTSNGKRQHVASAKTEK